MAEQGKDQSSGSTEQKGYLENVKSYIPSLSGTGETAKDGVGKAQDGAHTVGTNVRDATKPIPIVGGITEGVGNAPIAQQIGGQEEEKGYLSKAYEYAEGTARTVYDSTGNAIGTVREKAGGYLHSSSTKENEDSAPADSDGKQKVLQQAEDTAKSTDEKLGGPGEAVRGGASEASDKAQSGASQASEKAQDGASAASESAQNTASSASDTVSGAAGSAKEKAGSAANTTGEKGQEVGSQAQKAYNDTTDTAKGAHRDVEDKAQSSVKDTVGAVQDSTGTKESTQGASEGLDQTADAAKGAARDVEDTAQKNTGDIAGGVGQAAKSATGENSTEDAKEGFRSVGGGVQNTVSGAGSSAYEGAKGVGGGVAETGKGIGGALGSGAQSAGGALGLGGGSKEE